MAFVIRTTWSFFLLPALPCTKKILCFLTIATTITLFHLLLFLSYSFCYFSLILQNVEFRLYLKRFKINFSLEWRIPLTYYFIFFNYDEQLILRGQKNLMAVSPLKPDCVQQWTELPFLLRQGQPGVLT